MAGWRILAERRIEAAMEAGAFRDLPGQGERLRLEENPLADPAWRLAFHVLKNADYRPRWVELAVEIREQLAQARTEYERDLRRDGAGQAAGQRFAERLGEINRLIDELNLLAPSDPFRRPRLSIQRELSRLLRAGDGEAG